MKKKVVNKIISKSRYWFIISYGNSCIGSDRKCNRFPLVQKDKALPGSINGIKVGDVLRCDGYPFASRPKCVGVKTYNKHGKPQVSVFSPVKVGEFKGATFWALRNK